MNSPRLIVVDDSALMREAIQLVLALQYEVVASVPDGEAAAGGRDVGPVRLGLLRFGYASF